MSECILKKKRKVVALLLRGILLGVTFLAVTALAESIRYYNRSFKVSPEGAMLILSNPSGSINVKAWNRPEIKVFARLLDSVIEVKDKQTDNTINIDVHSSRIGPAHFDVSVPQTCTLDLKCLNGSIQISSMEGHIIAQTMEGGIMLENLNSPNITAKSISGPIIYNGTLDPKGIYYFHSNENSVDITLPASSAFTLMATAVTGRIELGGFQLNESTSKDKRIAGRCGRGGASLNLSTHRGQIRLRKK
jgi:hypothetical protein